MVGGCGFPTVGLETGRGSGGELAESLEAGLLWRNCRDPVFTAALLKRRGREQRLTGAT